MCHMSRDMFHVSHIYLFFLDKVLKLFGGGSVWEPIESENGEEELPLDASCNELCRVTLAIVTLERVTLARVTLSKVTFAACLHGSLTNYHQQLKLVAGIRWPHVVLTIFIFIF